MKKIYTILFVLTVTASSLAQQQMLVVDAFQEVATASNTGSNFIKLPSKKVFPVLGGLNDWDGMNNHINVFGSKLLIESSEIGSDGITRLVLRREDGLDFFQLFPTLKAKLVPMPLVQDYLDQS